jgi:hypothetical protein
MSIFFNLIFRIISNVFYLKGKFHMLKHLSTLVGGLFFLMEYLSIFAIYSLAIIGVPIVKDRYISSLPKQK